MVSYGTLMARSVSLGYFMLAFSHGMGGVLRGGRSFPGFHDYNDNLMVWTESSMDFNGNPFFQGYQDCVLGISHNLGLQFCYLYLVFFQEGLAAPSNY